MTLSDYDINGAFHKDGKIRLQWRTWDGIDKPDYYWSNGMDSVIAKDLAKDLAKQLIIACNEADIFNETEDDKKLKELILKRDELTNEIDRLSNKSRFNSK